VLPLSIENLTCVFRTGALTKCGNGAPFGWWLGIPEEHFTDPLSAASWWVRHGKDRRWRKIIYHLDHVGETGLADELMPYSEPPSGV